VWPQLQRDVRHSGLSPLSVTNGSSLAIQWSVVTGSTVQASAVIDGFGNVYIGSNDGIMHAVSVKGSLLWQYQAGTMVRTIATPP
jgi:hypothetical protein